MFQCMLEAKECAIVDYGPCFSAVADEGEIIWRHENRVASVNYNYMWNIYCKLEF